MTFITPKNLNSTLPIADGSLVARDDADNFEDGWSSWGWGGSFNSNAFRKSTGIVWWSNEPTDVMLNYTSSTQLDLIDSEWGVVYLASILQSIWAIWFWGIVTDWFTNANAFSYIGIPVRLNWFVYVHVYYQWWWLVWSRVWKCSVNDDITVFWNWSFIYTTFNWWAYNWLFIVWCDNTDLFLASFPFWWWDKNLYTMSSAWVVSWPTNYSNLEDNVWPWTFGNWTVIIFRTRWDTVSVFNYAWTDVTWRWNVYARFATLPTFTRVGSTVFSWQDTTYLPYYQL